MIRKIPVILAIALLGFTAACGSTGTNAVARRAGAEMTASASPCPTSETRKFAKTRFVADAALAGGAFKRYIYDPAREGKFQKGAQGKTVALIKAAAAGAFTINRLDAAKANAEADPALCTALIAPLSRFSSAVSGLVGKARAGTGSISPSNVSTGSSYLTELHDVASKNGIGFTDNTSASV